VPVQVTVPQELEQLLKSKGQPVPAPISGFALVDTGATMSMVDDHAIEGLGVGPVGTATLQTAGGPLESALYPVRVVIGVPQQPMLDLSFGRITSGPLQKSGLLCLLGRDLLQHVLLVYDGANGRFTVAF
jgi:predicted aspartyl protease